VSFIPNLEEQVNSDSPLLNAVYDHLGYRDGSLLNASYEPSSPALLEEWLEKGDWLALAKDVGAEKLLFVNNDPVFVFYSFPKEPSVREQLDVFRRVWCMSRPQCLFLAFPGELKVYSLKEPPARSEVEWKNRTPLAVAKSVGDVLTQLRAYHRDRVESGRLFADERFGKLDQRADKRLILDLKAIRKSLRADGLDMKYAHSLIGHSIFIRYLEDRGVLKRAYFEAIASHNIRWQELLVQDLEKQDLSLNENVYFYHQVLLDREFTFALFKQLSEDFNGDMFPRDEQEEENTEAEHLISVRNFLLGNTDSQQSLFFWAYNFKIVPIDLISSIYEEFYHNVNEDDNTTHYTPSVLVEHVLSNILTREVLNNVPTILDPACGSGIFLVEAFRRIVRHRVQHLHRPLTSDELRLILRDQIRGVEINTEATRIAAFSLYLALLHYQEPPEILGNKRLPKLIYRDQNSETEDTYSILVSMNAFSLTSDESIQLKLRLEASQRFPRRSELEAFYRSARLLPFKAKSFDIVIGNPPWGYANSSEPDIQEEQKLAGKWCHAFDWTIGDKELSQAFVARIMSLVKPGGICGLLLSTGVFFKHHKKSKDFRKQWLENVAIEKVVNFIHVRHVFFNADSPFAFVLFRAQPASLTHLVEYWSVKKTKIVEKLRSVILDNTDIHHVRQHDLMNAEYLWKVYWWGGHRDALLINTLKLNPSIEQLSQERGWPEPAQGYTPGSEDPSDWLKEYDHLPTESLHNYNKIGPKDLLPVPERVHRRGTRYLYEGWRLLIKQGVSQAKGLNGRIEARLDNLRYSVNNSVHGVSLEEALDWERKVIVGILWSSLARYYYFMTASSWGTWHHQIHLEEAISLPIRLPEDTRIRGEIVNIVNQLQSWQDDSTNVDNTEIIGGSVAQLERQLDNIVFDLYGLGEPDRDLIRDMCQYGLDFFYNHSKSIAASRLGHSPKNHQGFARDIPVEREQQLGIEGYLHAFLQTWNRELEPDGEFSWRIIRPDDVPMIAVVFTTQEPNTVLDEEQSESISEWNEVLAQCSEALLLPVEHRIYIDGMVRVVTDSDIIIIKRDEQRLWTRTAAREDAEATLLQAVLLQNEAEHEIS
jgi:type I restriction-modification system DNA methylase subunit